MFPNKLHSAELYYQFWYL